MFIRQITAPYLGFRKIVFVCSICQTEHNRSFFDFLLGAFDAHRFNILIGFSDSCRIDQSKQYTLNVKGFLNHVTRGSGLITDYGSVLTQQLIEQGAGQFMRQLRELEAVDTLTQLRAKHTQLAEEELARALRQLEQGKPAEEVMKRLAHGLTNKFLHQPSVQLRQASADGRDDLQALAAELFKLDAQSRD